MIWVVHPGSRIQGSKIHRIPDPDPLHWFFSDPESKFFSSAFQNCLQIWEIHGSKKKKVMKKIFFTPLSFIAVFGSGMGKNQDPGSGINIPDPQHCQQIRII
jgi:hypothetical protein